jgi:putative transcriptional regulator
MPEDQRRVYNRLAVLRAERGLSRKQLADKLGINYQTIGYIERGDYNPSLELSLTIAEFFRLPVEAIFSLKPLAPLSATIFGNPPAGAH